MHLFVIFMLLSCGLTVLAGAVYVIAASAKEIARKWNNGQRSAFVIARVMLVYSLLLASGSALVWLSVRAILVRLGLVS